MKRFNIYLFSLSLLLTSCSVFASSSNSSVESSFESSSVSSNSSSSSSSSSDSSNSSSSLSSIPVVFSEMSFDSKDTITDYSSFTKNDIKFKLVKAESNSTGFVSLNKGGYITNVTPFANNISSIKVVFSTEVEYASLVTKSSAFEITSPMNGAYEVTSNSTYSFTTIGNYFSLYSPLGLYNIESITLNFDSKPISKEKSKVIDFYTINDTHGAADQNAEKYRSGIKKLSSYILSEERKSPETSIMLSSGDMWQGGIQSNHTRGESMVNWMNLTGFEGMGIGNHEFDWKVSIIEENSKKANFPFLGINVTDANGVRPDFMKPSVVVSRGGVKVGVIGAIGNLANSIAVASLGGYQFNWDKTPSMVKTEADRLRNEEGCEIVVLSIHNSASNVASGALEWDGIDAIFEGHTHRSYSFTDSKGIPHVQTYAYGSNIWHVQFKYDSSKDKFVFNTFAEADYATITGSYSDDEMTTKLYNYYEKDVSVLKNEVVYTSSSGITRSELASFSAKSMYNYYKDSYDGERKFVGAIVNSACARTDLTAGNITYGNILEALPFENENVMVHMTLSKFNSMKSYYVGYTGDTTGLSSTDEVEVVILSYVSDKEDVKSRYGLVEDSRDSSIYLYDIVADAFRNGEYA